MHVPTSRSSFGTPALFASLMLVACVPPAHNEVRVTHPANIDLPEKGNYANFDKIRQDVLGFNNQLGKNHEYTRTATRPGFTANVNIHSIGKTKDIDWDVALPRLRVIGRVINTDRNNTEERYKLEPNSTYLIWVEPTPNPGLNRKNQWGLFKLPDIPIGTSTKMWVGYIELCEKHWSLPRPDDTDFKDCPKAHSQAPVAKSEASMWGTIPFTARFFRSVAAHLGGALQTAKGTWFECGSGCCSGTGQVQ